VKLALLELAVEFQRRVKNWAAWTNSLMRESPFDQGCRFEEAALSRSDLTEVE
jgi:hypothetical protein